MTCKSIMKLVFVVTFMVLINLYLDKVDCREVQCNSSFDKNCFNLTGGFESRVKRQLDDDDYISCEIPNILNGHIVYTENGKPAEDTENKPAVPGSRYDFVESLSVICDEHYSLVTYQNFQNELQCNYDGRWSNSWPTCRKYCSFEEITGESIRPHCKNIDGQSIECSDGDHNTKLLAGTSATIHCKTGFKHPLNTRDTKLICLENGKWSDSATNKELDQSLTPCQRIEMLKPLEVPVGIGFFDSGQSSCSIPLITNGRIVDSSSITQVPDTIYSGSSLLRVSCNPNFDTVIGREHQNSNICEGGKWKETWATCQKFCSLRAISKRNIHNHCRKSNGEVFDCPHHVLIGSTVNMHCKTGYKNSQSDVVLTCLDTGNWNKEALKCEPVCGLITPQVHGNSGNRPKRGTPRNKEMRILVADGVPISINEAPWHVGLHEDNVQICGGTIISERVVLSAAHCFTTEASKLINPTSYKVGAGKSKRLLGAVELLTPQIKDIQEVGIPSSYPGKEEEIVADIATIIIKGFFEYQHYIVPACLDFTGLKYPESSTTGFVTGWGLSNIGGSFKQSPSSHLKAANLPIVDFATCKSMASSFFKSYVVDNKICAGYIAMDGPAVCQGDSGGGIMLPKDLGVGNMVYYLAGLASHTQNDFIEKKCSRGFYNLFTNIQEYKDFINQAITKSLISQHRRCFRKEHNKN